ncbi:MAG: glycosyltransferase [Gammaproteobacteria bacterium]
MLSALVSLSLIVGTSVLFLPWRPWSTNETLDFSGGATEQDLSDISVLIPARNEAPTILTTLRALANQGDGLRIIVIDDESVDGTADVIQSSGIAGVELIRGAALEEGWSGKLWALEQGRQRAATPLTLLLDADIVLAPGILANLRQKLLDEQLSMVSLMADLGMQSRSERMLLPAFVYFFKMIYPFKLANDPHSSMAAAAGGCILLRADALTKIGGFTSLRDAMIDDCTLAKRIKSAGGGIWVGLTHSAISQRRYTFQDIWHMVARNAYTQLQYSPLLLATCTALMFVYYLIPPIAVLLGSGLTRIAALVSFMIASIPYAPVLRYYRLPVKYAPALPGVAAIYLAVTWHSAWRYLRGERSRWKGRQYQRAA